MGKDPLFPALLLAGILLAPAAALCVNPPAGVPAGVILVKGAWSSASDSSTPVPEAGEVRHSEYTSAYFHLSYPLVPGWTQEYAGPPPSDSGYYVLAQIQSPEDAREGNRGTLLIAAQDMFFSNTPAGSALELVKYTSSHLLGDYTVERPASEVSIAGHSFARLDYSSAAAHLHWATLATEIRCHAVQFVFTSPDPDLIEPLVAGMNALKLPPENGMASGAGARAAPLCVAGYADGDHVIRRIDPVLTDHRHNPIPVRVIIDVHGRVKHIHFISAFPEQSTAIGEALRQWRFRPYIVNGKPVEVETGIMFGVAPSKALISGRQEPQLVPARRHAPI